TCDHDHPAGVEYSKQPLCYGRLQRKNYFAECGTGDNRESRSELDRGSAQNGPGYGSGQAFASRRREKSRIESRRRECTKPPAVRKSSARNATNELRTNSERYGQQTVHIQCTLQLLAVYWRALNCSRRLGRDYSTSMQKNNRSDRHIPWWMYVIGASYILTLGLILYLIFWGPAQLDKGFTLAFSANAMKITSVIPNSPVAKGGLLAGDRVVI